MTTSTSCPFCHGFAAVGREPWPFCAHCGHRADLARVFCTCPKCSPLRPIALEGERLERRPLFGWRP